ncbi:MAG: SPOR domain-containing protein [Alphaproteobacteria bacterium]
MIIIAGSVLAVGALIAALVWGFSRGSSRNAPLLEADARPIKVRPDNPGGLRVPNQDELIFDRNRGARSTTPGALAPEAENPRVDQLRQQLAERAAQEAARSAPPPAAPAQPAAPQAAPRTAPQAAAPATPAPPTTTSALTAPSLPAPVPANAERFAPVANGRAQVQLGALPSETAARGEWERLQRRVPELLSNRRVTLAPLDREGQTAMFRIRTGGFADAATARAFCEEMKTRSIPCMVIGG